MFKKKKKERVGSKSTGFYSFINHKIKVIKIKAN